MKKRTETTTETHEVWVIRQAQVAAATGDAPLVFCVVCGSLARMRAPEEAAVLSGLRTRAVYALVEAGRAHFEERPDGKLFVCLASLSLDAV